ncbi:hypothetical protein MMC07_000808 [Pseudocyphellaria aurata]|nr:hypothetical protein [Pseudocyphellaria aurata]
MLSHGPSSASNRLRRAKSSSSTQIPHFISFDPKSVDPASARQDALAAASLAFERASERAMVTQEIKERSKCQTFTLAQSSEDAHNLDRKQSVRYTGPTAVLTKEQPITVRVAPDQISNLGSPTEVVNTSSQKPNEFTTYQPENYLKSLPKMEEDFPGNRISSLPSSYRKLRKARSLFNPRSHRPVISMNGTPKRISSANRHIIHSPLPRLHRSFSFLRDDSDNLTSNTDRYVIQDTAVQIARDRYLHQLEHQSLKDKPSYSTFGKPLKPQKAFRKTVRTSSINSSGSAIGPAAPSSSGAVWKKGFGHRARGFSLSLKNKLKRVFHRPTDTELVFPVQQVDASRLHFGDYMSTFSGVDQQYHSIPLPDCETTRKVRSRESVCLDVPVMLGQTSHPGSIRSVRSDDEISNGKSRVTSWTNSTAANTMTSNQLIEKKRLSIIQENGGPHQPSSSIRHYEGLGELFHQPIRSNHRNTRVDNVVDSQRIYSALQRRIDEDKRLVNSGRSDCGTETEASRIGIQASGTDRIALRSRTADNTSTNSLGNAYGMTVSKSTMCEPSTTTIGHDSKSGKEGYLGQMYQKKLLDTQVRLTPQQTAERNESGSQSPKRPLRELKSTFFPSSLRIERSNKSPYRRAMNTSSEDEDGIEVDVKSFCDEEGESASFRQITPNGARARSVTGTESIYSRTSSGNTPKLDTSSLSLKMSAGSGELGSALIITTKARKYKQSLSAFGQPRSSSVTPSGDWQEWMASQVDKLENEGVENRRIFEPNFVKENGHKRESAQIDGDDVRIGKLKTFNERPKQPLGMIRGNSPSQPVLRHKASLPMVDRFPLLEIEQLAQSNTGQNEAGSTTTPIRWPEADPEYSSGWKNTASLPLKRSCASIESRGNTSMPRQGQIRDSENTDPQKSADSYEARVHGLLQVKKMGKMQSRYSPERIARLRRRQSANGLVSEGAVKLAPEVGEQQHVPKSQMISSPATSTTQKDGDIGSDGSMTDLLGPVVDDVQVLGGRKLVDVFLSNRRRQMRISEEISAIPAFL